MWLVRIIGLVAILVGAAIAVGALRARSQARTLLDDIRRLDASADVSSSVKSLRKKHRNQLAHEECRNEACVSEFVVSNWLLSSLRLAPTTELRARVFVFQGKLDAAGVDYTSAILKQDSPVVHVQEDFCAGRTDIRCDHFALNPHGRNVGPAWNGNVEFGQLTTNEQKRAAWGLDLDCFVSLRGCRDISVLSPIIWRATGPGLVSSCLRSSADSEAEASQPLSDACLGR